MVLQSLRQRKLKFCIWHRKLPCWFSFQTGNLELLLCYRDTKFQAMQVVVSPLQRRLILQVLLY